MGKYDDIIDLPHHQSETRPHMSMHDRAAQFAPFAALTGYGDAVEETARLTDVRIELSDTVKEEINSVLQTISDSIGCAPDAVITYFVPDAVKEGGAYTTITGKVKKIDRYTRSVILADGKTIPIDDLLSIEILH